MIDDNEFDDFWATPPWEEEADENRFEDLWADLPWKEGEQETHFEDLWSETPGGTRMASAISLMRRTP